MNNGNPLSSLLGITSATPAATKASSAKARAESTQKFQQALAQVRPEIAARKPVARKELPASESASAARSATKSTTQRTSQYEANRGDVSSRAGDNKPDAAAKPVGKPQTPARDTATSERPVEQKNTGKTVATQQQTRVGQVHQNEGGAVEQSVSEALAAAETDEVLESADTLLNPANLPLLALHDLATEGEIDLSLIQTDPVALESGLLAPEPDLLTATPALSAVGNLSADSGDLALSPLIAGGRATLAQSSTTPVASGLVATAGVIAGAQTAEIQAATDALNGELATDEPVAGDAGENPDFLLLNTKAAANKLTETAMASATLDKTTPADLAKPAVVGAAVETLTRMTEAQSPAARAFVVQTGVPVPVGTPQWSQAVGDKVLWLAAQNVSAAEIRLDPPELGPMQVRVSVNQDQASITFTSPHAGVREALDQQLNRLRDMFSEQGLNLVNVDVSDKSFAQREREQGESAKQHTDAELDDEDLTPVGITQAISMRLVDHYA